MTMVQVLESIGAGEGNRTLVISLEGCQFPNKINAWVDKFTVRAGLGAVVKIGVVHLLK